MPKIGYHGVHPHHINIVVRVLHAVARAFRRI